MSNTTSTQTIIALPGRRIFAKTGVILKAIKPATTCIMDSHMHIENGACAPLPLLWDKAPALDRVARDTIDTFSTKGVFGALFSLVKGDAGKVQVMSTFDIGNRGVRELGDALGADSVIGKSSLYSIPGHKERDFQSLLVAQMMDMEYAHIAGFNGQTIYHDDETPWYYYRRSSGYLPENEGEKVILFKEDALSFCKFERQLTETVAAVKANPLQLFAMYFYAPQRWNRSKTTSPDLKRVCGPWDHPFREVATKKQPGLFLGFKMYTPLGTQPLDPRLPYLHDKTLEGDCFYKRCAEEGIPILAHCSPGGMTTHEIKYFIEYDSGAPPTYSGTGSTPADALYVTSHYSDRQAKIYFNENYVHPKAWRKVLVKYPELKLCLAHFGGTEFAKGLGSSWVTEILALTKEYPNVYTDLSCWNMGDSKDSFREIMLGMQHEHIRHKLLFGTDWYMTLIALGGKSYKKFCEEAWEMFMGLPGGEEMWVNCTFLNPFRFYGLFDKDEKTRVRKLDNVVAALQAGKHDKGKLRNNLQFLNRLEKEYLKLSKQWQV